VLQGVFHHGLQDEARDLGPHQIHGNLHADLKTILETHALNGQVGLDEGKFFPERDQLIRRSVQVHPEEVPQSPNHPVGGVRVRMNQG